MTEPSCNSDDLDQLLLLTVQSVCNKNNVKIPWGEIADTMGHNVTEGAIVQHLAKLRSRRVSAQKPVPPPLRRGGVGSSTTKSSGAKRRRSSATPTPAGKTSATIPVLDNSSDEDYVDGSETKARGKRARKTKPPQLEEVPIKAETESEDESEYEAEFMAPGASFLALPNDRYATHSAASSSPSSDDESEDSEESDTENSKLVVLRYRKGIDTSNVPASATTYAPTNNQNEFKLTSPMPYMGDAHGHLIHQQPSDFLTSHSQYTSDWDANYMMNDTGADSAPYNLGFNQTLAALDTPDETQSLPSTALQWDMSHNSGGQAEYISGSGGFEDFFNDTFYYPQSEYTGIPDWEQKPKPNGDS